MKPSRAARGYARLLGAIVFTSLLSAITAPLSAQDLTQRPQAFTTLASFNSTDGESPDVALVQATNGDLYGETLAGGASRAGTVFKITPSGTLTALYSFCSECDSSDGYFPYGGLVQAANGDLYGTASEGGAYGYGTVFKITPAGALTRLYSFCSQSNCTDGYLPYASLIQAANGDLYGTTFMTVFKITPSGALTTLYTFCSKSNCADGYQPSALVQAANGDLYGTAQFGGVGNAGTVFKITPAGALTTLYGFCAESNCADGSMPRAGLAQASDGDLYGTTEAGGASGSGTVFKITAGGTLTTLHSFCSLTGCTDGATPDAGLIRATDGYFYGTTYFGGANGDGTVFKITPGGALTTLHSFCAQSNCTDGAYPYAALVQATDGKLYGTTWSGGANGNGTVFSLYAGLRPFVETRPTSGEVGATVEILGTHLAGATGVTFNGVAAEFTLKSPMLITATVPAGATTGEVQVVTPGATLSSNVPFRVP
jgi:uncharacterized repeat protein (TIGR03803 family)